MFIPINLDRVFPTPRDWERSSLDYKLVYSQLPGRNLFTHSYTRESEGRVSSDSSVERGTKALGPLLGNSNGLQWRGLLSFPFNVRVLPREIYISKSTWRASNLMLCFPLGQPRHRFLIDDSYTTQKLTGYCGSFTIPGTVSQPTRPRRTSKGN